MSFPVSHFSRINLHVHFVNLMFIYPYCFFSVMMGKSDVDEMDTVDDMMMLKNEATPPCQTP
jgi:hypothetical protein